MCRDADWVDIIIDDQLFSSVPRWEALEAKVCDLDLFLRFTITK